jgi:hypothetical protein
VSTDEVINSIQFAAEEALPALQSRVLPLKDTTVTATGGVTALTSSV